MSHLPLPAPKDNPAKPYKAIGAAVSATGASLIANHVLPHPYDLIVIALMAGLATFFIPNPKVTEQGSPSQGNTQETLF